MKKLFYYFCVLLASTSISSCVQDRMFEDESDDQLELADYRYACSKKDCLPTIMIGGVGRIANVYLSCTNYNNDHEFIFKCWDSSGFVYKEEQFLSTNTSFTIGFPPASTKEGYKVSYRLSCRTCYECYVSGVIQINFNETIEVGSINNCLKDYLGYNVKLDYECSNSVIVETQDYYNFPDTDHFMNVDKMRVFTIDAYGNKTQYFSSSIEFLSPYRIRISGLPTTNNTYSMKSGRVELYNEKCKGNFEHYMFFTYTSNGNIRLEQYDLPIHKEHK